MSAQSSDESANLQPESSKGEALEAFSLALGAELDGLGYVPHPGRSAALAKDLGIGRTKTYRLLKGLVTPTPELLAALRARGASLDRILDHMNGGSPPEMSLALSGGTVPALVQGGQPGAACSVIARPLANGTFELITVLPGQAIPLDAVPIQSLQFIVQDTLAIVEDDAETLSLVAKQMSRSFSVQPFASAKELLNHPRGFAAFSAFLIDWRLPDMTGEELIQMIRQKSLAPIFILTGDTSASTSIVKALNRPNVHHVAKPADDIILTKRIKDAIRQVA